MEGQVQAVPFDLGDLNCFIFQYWFLFQEPQASGLPEYIKIVEVGPRDGLQNEKVTFLFCFLGVL